MSEQAALYNNHCRTRTKYIDNQARTADFVDSFLEITTYYLTQFTRQFSGHHLQWAAAVLADRAFSRQPKIEKLNPQFK